MVPFVVSPLVQVIVTFPIPIAVTVACNPFADIVTFVSSEDDQVTFWLVALDGVNIRSYSGRMCLFNKER